jgi:hypothetical protein
VEAMLPSFFQNNTFMFITRTSKITPTHIQVDENIVYQNTENLPFQENIKAAFKQLNQPYPKFYKMDALCKLAFAGASYLWQQDEPGAKYKPEEVAIVLINKASTLLTDIEHQKSIQSREQYFPSPAIFVYTLPNIMMGEISIRYKLQGENLLLVSDVFDEQLLFRQVEMLFRLGKAKAVLTGMVDIDEENYESTLLWVENESSLENMPESSIFAPSNVKNIYLK